jgi:hypothetical protein
MIPRYVAAWFGMMVIAILNGGFRDYVYRPHMGDLAAHQLSTVLLVLGFAAYFFGLFRLWPLQTARQARSVGLLWFLMTVAFEVGIGLMAGLSWAGVLQAYNLLDGRIWILVPLWVLVAPYLYFRCAGAK